MNTGSYRFPLGGFDVISVSDGAFNYPLESFFANVQMEEVEEELRRRKLPTDRGTTPYACLFVDTGQHRVLIDTGAGDLGAAAAAMFPSIDHTMTVTGMLPGHLEAAGVEPGWGETGIIH